MPMPAAIVLIVCHVNFLPHASPLDEANAAFTKHRPFEWSTVHSEMQCRRQEVQLYDQAASMGADPVPFTRHQCDRASWQVRMQWDMGHENRPWRVWRTYCPVPIVDTRNGKVLSWKMPECPRINRRDRVAVHCEVDTAI